MIPDLRWQDIANILKDIVDILIVSFIIYKTFLLIKGTRAIQLILGLVILIFVFSLADRFGLFTVGWIFNNFVGSISIRYCRHIPGRYTEITHCPRQEPFLQEDYLCSGNALLR